MADKFTIEIEGLQQVMHRIKSLPDAARDQVLHDVSEYSLEVIRDEPSQKYVTRTQAYGSPFSSDRQRRWFFASLADGSLNVPYHRTGKMSAGWEAHQMGAQVTFRNPTPGAQFVMGLQQSRHEKLVGWRKITDIVEKYLDFRNSKFRGIVMAAYQKTIRKLQLG